MLYFPRTLKTQFTGIYEKVYMELKDAVLPGYFVAESLVHIATTGSSKQTTYSYKQMFNCKRNASFDSEVNTNPKLLQVVNPL